MKINIISVGKFKEKYLTDAFAEYKKRLTPFYETECLEISECGGLNNPREIIDAEGRLIAERLAKVKGFTIALDRGGEALDSEGFATALSAAVQKGGGVNFVIGGSHGLSAQVLEKADKVISFGKMTFPHRLFRVMLIEQIYRAVMIENGRQYHK